MHFSNISHRQIAQELVDDKSKFGRVVAWWRPAKPFTWARADQGLSRRMFSLVTNYFIRIYLIEQTVWQANGKIPRAGIETKDPMGNRRLILLCGDIMGYLVHSFLLWTVIILGIQQAAGNKIVHEELYLWWLLKEILITH